MEEFLGKSFCDATDLLTDTDRKTKSQFYKMCMKTENLIFTSAQQKRIPKVNLHLQFRASCAKVTDEISFEAMAHVTAVTPYNHAACCKCSTK